MLLLCGRGGRVVCVGGWGGVGGGIARSLKGGLGGSGGWDVRDARPVYFLHFDVSRRGETCDAIA
jgi:hypothetical protein